MPEGVTATPMCVFEDKYNNLLCALICDTPVSKNECGKATCYEFIGSHGVCIYNDTNSST